MPRSFRSQQRHTTITTAGNKMQLTQSISASEAWLHPKNPNPSHTRRVRHPARVERTK
jgi:hypothetical protein